ncbi:MFS monocarboxylate transporter [Coccidioides immitis RS]|uniref:MFS monocarboxylate transporter n=2 Tax=Coccidioides immitis TaxID=5501 RepID=J3KEE7_COCIM|nr:MFS monocarboxylate transporter [Coccidioides immitis RS]EAS33852.3 MFS monocarboxylate transporter [Coccidioides immitis RS]KMP05044.1 hypothetical protein CIRG_04725 [Coccidioides immitis RMSCC 2394]
MLEMGEPGKESEPTGSSSPGLSSCEDAVEIVEKSGFENDSLSFDHGWKAWSQVLASWIMFFDTWGIVTAFGVFQTYYEQAILSQESPSTISWIGSIQSFLLLFIGAVTGPLFDAGYSRHLLISGTFLVPFGLMMTSVAKSFWQILLAQGFCLGLGCGCLFIPCVAIIPQYFKKKKAFANGIAATGSGVGGVIYPIMFRQLQLKIGFAWAVRVLGFVSLATLLVACCLLKIRFQPTEKRALIQLHAFKDPVYTLFCIGEFIGFSGLYNTMVYIQPYAIDNRIIGEHLAFYLLAMLNTASSFGRILPNYIADYIGPLNVIGPMAVISGILGFCWIGIHSSGGVIALAVLYGFFSGGYVSIPPIVIMNITPDLRDFGTRLGMSFVFVASGALIGTPIGGALISHMGGDYLGVKVFTGACLLCSGIIMCTARFIKTGPHLLARM